MKFYQTYLDGQHVYDFADPEELKVMPPKELFDYVKAKRGEIIKGPFGFNEIWGNPPVAVASQNFWFATDPSETFESMIDIEFYFRRTYNCSRPREIPRNLEADTVETMICVQMRRVATDGEKWTPIRQETIKGFVV